MMKGGSQKEGLGVLQARPLFLQTPKIINEKTTIVKVNRMENLALFK